jgi:AsmA protein
VRILKWISWGLAGLVVLILLGLGILVWVIDPNGFKPTIEARVKQATGREFRLTGDIELGFFPWLAVRTGAGSFGNAPGFGPEPMATWRSAQLGAKLFPLLRGDLVIDRVKLEGAEVRLVRRADGTANWQGMGSGEAAPADANEPGAKSRYVTIDGVDIADGHVLFVDESGPRRIEINALHLATDEIAPDRPFTDTTIEGILHMDGFAAAGVPFRLEVPRAELAGDYSRFDIREFKARFGGLEAQGAVGGKLAAATQVAGRFASNDFDARALLASIGVAAPKTTDPKALTRVAVDTAWRFDGGAVSLDPLAVTLDDTHLDGFFRRAAGDAPVGEFSLRGDALDLARYIPPTDPASEPFVLPTAALRALKFRGELELEQATLDDVVMKGVKLRLLLDEQGLRSQAAGPEKS